MVSGMEDVGNFAGQVARRLQTIYKSSFNEGLVNRIIEITKHKFPVQVPLTEKDVILITYANSIENSDEKPLQTLNSFLLKYLKEIISCVHILPFFPSTSDDGFAISNFVEVDPAFGDWNDIALINEKFCLMSDLVINHVSSRHQWFINFLENRSPGRNFFIEFEDGIEYSKVVRPRSTPLFTKFTTINGAKEVWTTFSSDQADLNFANPDVLLEMIKVLVFYISKGIRIIRLDAIAFIWKMKNSACLHLQETHEIVKLLRDIATYICPGTIILTETNVPNTENWSYFGNSDEAHMVYQFSLPPLLLYTLFSGSSEYLNNWAKTIPLTDHDQTFLNYTASHDGIGVRPLEGILPTEHITGLIDGMIAFGGLISNKINKDGSLSPYEINITFYDAMMGTWRGKDNFQKIRFICSQAIMLSLKGVPAFYIHSLFATPNYYEGVESTGIARKINRKRLNKKDIEDELSNEESIPGKVFDQLSHLIKIRKQCSAFHPESTQKILEIDDGIFAFVRHNTNSGHSILCISNISDQPRHVIYEGIKKIKGYDLLSEEFCLANPILLKAYQTRWIEDQFSLK